LTLVGHSGKSYGEVVRIPSEFYARWRVLALAGDSLRESDVSPPPERLLQQIWFHLRIDRDRLKTEEGIPLRVLHPGFWNREAGPDFRQALLQFAHDRPVTGDVEVDLHPSGWRGHGHADNPNYRGVVLHVVWEADERSRSSLPTLALRTRLDAPLNELRVWLGTDPGWPGVLSGQCSAPLRGLSESALDGLLRQAAQVRLEGKGRALAARARQTGWDQALWEGLFGALGFKHNVWPMRRLAELLPEMTEHCEPGTDPLLIQARLLGVSGLLPAELTRGSSSVDRYLRQMWDLWWRDRGRFDDVALPRSLWRFGGLRPANQPPRRLALAAHWLAAGGLPGRLERWFTTSIPDAQLESSLGEVLRAGEGDPFWSRHWTFQSRRIRNPRPLLGSSRVTDLAMNVILPWLRIRAVSGGNGALAEVAEHRYQAWPRGQDNATLRLAQLRLFGSVREEILSTAARQQGLLQIVRDFCEQSNALCESCRFPELVRSLGAGDLKSEISNLKSHP